MFAVQLTSYNNFNDAVILSDNESGTTAVIVPSCGAILQAFTVLIDNKIVNIIDSYSSEMDFKENVTIAGFKGSKLSPFVCRMKMGAYHFGEKNYSIKKFYLQNHAIHGLLYDKKFSLLDSGFNLNGAYVSLKYAYRAEDSGYPFDYDCIINYKLEPNNKLTVETKIVNMDKGLIPIQDGWHPYFTFGKKIDELQLEFQSKEIVDFDEELIPTGSSKPYQDFGSIANVGATKFDNCFLLNFSECQPMCVLRDPERNISLEIHPGKEYPYLQIYTPPHRNSIAIENLSGPPDGFNNGISLKVLKSGETTAFKTSFKINN